MSFQVEANWGFVEQLLCNGMLEEALEAKCIIFEGLTQPVTPRTGHHLTSIPLYFPQFLLLWSLIGPIP